jgi:crotonobetainyl-CoA:carnitine CoA-transferase CaiB-like acyl-CoA transferase
MIGVANDNLWRKFCGVVGLDDIVDDPRFRTNADRVNHRDETIARVQSALSVKSAAYWNDALSKVGVPCSPIHTLAQLTDHAHTQASDVIVAYDHAVAGPLKGVGHPVLINGQPRSAGAPPPMHGQHTADILADLGLSAEEIDQLRRDRIVG